MIKNYIVTCLLILLIIMSFKPKQFKKVDAIEIKNDWIVSESGKNEWIPAKVPGCIHTDLLSSNKIEDPFYRTNEKKLQWIDKTDWEYKTTFSTSNIILQKQNIRLYFKGLDTYADVYLNDILLLKADNMFREWKVDCKSLLKNGNNELKIIFHSPTKKGLEKLKELGFQPPTSNDQSEIGEMDTNKVSIFTRKAPYDYGWDWGPRLVTSGIWRPVYLEAWDNAKIENAHYQIKNLISSKAVLIASFEILSSTNQKITLLISDSNGSKNLAKLKTELKQGENTVTANVEIDNPKLWWTNGLGEPYLYKLKAELLLNNETIDEKTTNVGIRTVKIIQKPDSVGKSFYIELNGIPIFMKGADYIPNDIFPSRVTPEKYEKIIQSAADANINMLRVWGGGIYENDIFYDLCDQKGILIWHDFMFACAMYPVNNEFIENVRQEFIDNIKRLRNHPCIALWCGNNEIQGAWAEGDENRGWRWKEKFNAKQRKYLWDSYYQIFYKTLPEVLKTLDSTRFYWPSSPIANYDEYDGKMSFTSGDVHYWGVWHGKEPFEEFAKKIGRFMSEYGFQSFPEFKTVQSYTLPEDYSIESEVMASHQRSGVGNMLIKKYMSYYYKTPKDFESFLYVSQVQQAEAIKSAIEAHRSKMPLCMGTLYWQINDCWPVASWSSIDYYNRWKALHYFARKAYQKFLICPRLENGKIIIYAVSDSLETVNAQLSIKLIDFTGKILNSLLSTVQAKANTSTKVFEMQQTDFLNGANPQNSLLYAELNLSGEKLSDNILYFEPSKNLSLINPDIKKNIEKSGNNYKITIESENLAKNVYLSIDEDDGFFSDNYFDIIPGREIIVIYSPIKPINNFEQKLKIITLTDSY